MACRLLVLLCVLLQGALCSAQVAVDSFYLPGYKFLPYSNAGNQVAKVLDYNGDGHPDVLLGRSFQVDLLLENDGSGRLQPAVLPPSWQTAGGTFDILVTDLDRDGRDDLILARGPENGGSRPDNGNRGHDQVLLNQGNGSYLESNTLLPRGGPFHVLPAVDSLYNFYYHTGVAAGDLNHDGIVDLVFVSGGMDYLPGIGPHNNVRTISDTMAAAGHRNFSNQVYFGVTDSLGGMLPFADASLSSGIGFREDMSSDVLVADFNGDSLDDVFVVNFHDANTLQLLGLDDSAGISKMYFNEQSQPGHFQWDTTAFPLEKFAATSGDAADYDQDGDIDILLGMEHRNAPNSWPRLFRNDGMGNFSEADSATFYLPPVFRSTYAVQFYDVDGDGWLDIVGGGFHAFLWLQDSVSHRFTDATLRLPTHPNGNLPHTFHAYGMDLGDLNGDARPDIFLADTYEQVRLQWQRADGQFVDVTTNNLPPDGENSIDAAVADFNQDGFPDVVKISDDARNVNQLSLFMHQGTSAMVDGFPTFADRGDLISLTANFLKEVEAADIDGDGYPEIVLAGERFLRIYHNQQGLAFHDSTAAWLPANYLVTYPNPFRDLLLRDLNQDGHADMFLAMDKFIHRREGILVWNATLREFEDASSWLPEGPGLEQVGDADVRDINQDGLPDMVVVVGGLTGPNLRVYYSDTTQAGPARYRSLQLSGTNVFRNSPVFGDFNGDGKVDLCVAEHSSVPLFPPPPGITCYFNSDSLLPSFSPQLISNLQAGPDDLNDLQVQDLNADGSEDLLVANWERPFVLLGDSSGMFREVGRQLFPARRDSSHRVRHSNQLALGDFNQDSFPDLYYARDDQDLLFYGCGSHLLAGEEILPGDEELLLRIAPNPYSDRLRLHLLPPGPGQALITVNDLQGRRLWEGKVDLPGAQATFLDLPSTDFPPGLVIVTVAFGPQRTSQKALKSGR